MQLVFGLQNNQKTSSKQKKRIYQNVSWVHLNKLSISTPLGIAVFTLLGFFCIAYCWLWRVMITIETWNLLVVYKYLWWFMFAFICDCQSFLYIYVVSCCSSTYLCWRAWEMRDSKSSSRKVTTPATTGSLQNEPRPLKTAFFTGQSVPHSLGKIPRGFYKRTIIAV